MKASTCAFVVLPVLLATTGTSSDLPDPDRIVETLRLANDYFMAKWPDPGKEIVTNRARPSNIWTRGTYYEGLMALHRIDPSPRYYDYAVQWGEAHSWGLRNGTQTRNADDQCCGQTYIELFRIDPKPERIRDIKANIDFIVAGDPLDDWSWIDALQMAMPVYAKLAVQFEDRGYLDKMHQIYLYSKNVHGGNGLFNPAHGLWWRDQDFVPPYKTPAGKDCYWSRGNGWVIAAMVRVLEELPADSIYRGEYVWMLRTMAEALVPLQREDGFWNVSLHDPGHFGGKETTGTAFFIYAMAWGVRQGILPRDAYQPVIAKAWNAIVSDALHPDGFLGYVQGTGKEPKDGQPVTYESKPDFEDYGLGAFLLAGVEIQKLATAAAR
ncbi:MAG TPA: glycoside hydrolase family 88 protein [Opitutaceae bacterium]